MAVQIAIAVVVIIALSIFAFKIDNPSKKNEEGAEDTIEKEEKNAH